MAWGLGGGDGGGVGVAIGDGGSLLTVLGGIGGGGGVALSNVLSLGVNGGVSDLSVTSQ